MYTVFPHPDFRGDLRRIREDDPEGFALLAVFIEEYLRREASPAIFNSHYFFDPDGRISVKSFIELRDRGYPVKTVKPLQGMEVRFPEDLESDDREDLHYRILCAVNPEKRQVTLLGIIHRDDYNYEIDHPFTQRCILACIGTGNRQRTY